MPKWDVTVEGSTYEVEAPDQDTAWAWANDTHRSPAQRTKREMAAVQKQFADDEAARPWGERALINLGAGMDTALKGIGQLTGLSNISDEELKEKRRIDEQAANTMTGGGAMQFIGEMLPTAVVGGPAAGGVVKGLSMLPKVGKVMQAGGRIGNVGNLTRGAVEGAVGGAAMPVLSTESRAGNATLGATVGAALPAALAAGGSIRKNWSTKPTLATARAARRIEEVIGKPEMTRVVDQLKDPVMANPLPLSAATASDSTKLASLERGSRKFSDQWAEHDQQVAQKAWSMLQDATRTADELEPRITARETAIKEAKRDIATSPNALANAQSMQDLTNTITNLKSSPAAEVNREVRGVLNDAQRALASENAGPGHLTELWFKLGQDIDRLGKYDELSMLRDKVAQHADNLSNGRFSAMLDEYKANQHAVKSAEAHKQIREQFLSPEGVIRTTSEYEVPVVRSHQLRSVMARKGENKYGDLLGDTPRQDLEELALQLRRHEGYLPQYSPGPTQARGFDPMDILASGRRNPIYLLPGLRGIVGKGAEAADEATRAAINTALLNPTNFLNMVATKEAQHAPLNPLEETIRSLIMGSSRAAGVAVGDQ